MRISRVNYLQIWEMKYAMNSTDFRGWITNLNMLDYRSFSRDSITERYENEFDLILEWWRLLCRGRQQLARNSTEFVSAYLWCFFGADTLLELIWSNFVILQSQGHKISRNRKLYTYSKFRFLMGDLKKRYDCFKVADVTTFLIVWTWILNKNVELEF